MVTYWAEHAWLPSGYAAGVRIEARDGRIATVESGAESGAATVLRGLTLPGLANAHSHAFHRALRARTQAERGTFWTWRERMYAVAARLTPDSYLRLARAAYAEMALAGITAVGEFHYLHHGPGGTLYADPNAMGHALIEAAAQAGIAITLLDTCYLSGGPGKSLEGPQLRFGDGDAGRWAERVSALKPGGHAVVGAAVHSVRAVPPEEMGTVVAWAAEREAPLHAHVSEQRAENEAVVAAYGATPVAVLHRAGALGPRFSAVHATHLTEADRGLLAGTRSFVCMCPTTERDLADGIGPARELLSVGAGLTLGSDSHAVIDMFEEARGVELNERLRTERRGHFTAAELLHAATAAGHASLGRPHAGTIEAGAAADLVTIGQDTPRTAGFAPATAAETAVFAATAADVRHVVAGGREIVRDGRHLLVPDVGRALHEAIEELENA
ncbi:MAG: formimidoylglutamate deiminase [Streptosporangiales bacterium]|nr:formimidoylglutamate deiminase [Streptosporangiales bacterium]